MYKKPASKKQRREFGSQMKRRFFLTFITAICLAIFVVLSNVQRERIEGELGQFIAGEIESGEIGDAGQRIGRHFLDQIVIGVNL